MTSRHDAARSETSREAPERRVTRGLLPHDPRWADYYRAVCKVSGRRFVSRPVNLTPEERKRFADGLRSWRRDFPARLRLNPYVRL
jgi:hypothetical protein